LLHYANQSAVLQVARMLISFLRLADDKHRQVDVNLLRSSGQLSDGRALAFCRHLLIFHVNNKRELRKINGSRTTRTTPETWAY
jgi:hypothetical protein